MAHVAPYKKQLVDDLASRCAQAQVVGIVNVHGIPAPQFQAIRKKLWGRATITVAKNNLLRLALEQANAKKPDLVKLGETIEGQTAVVTADINPFRLFKELEATKTRAPPEEVRSLPRTSGSGRARRLSNAVPLSGSSRRPASPPRSSAGRSSSVRTNSW